MIFSREHKKCICSRFNYVLINKVCAHKCYLEPNKIPDENGNCVCNEDSFSFGDKCLKCSSSFCNSEGDGNNRCRCSKAYQSIFSDYPILICSPCSAENPDFEAGD